MATKGSHIENASDMTKHLHNCGKADALLASGLPLSTSTIKHEYREILCFGFDAEHD